MVNTVTGTISPSALGKTLMHEHIQFGYPGFQGDSTLGGWNKAIALKNTKPHIELAKRHGVQTIVDATPNECGRNAAFLKEVADTFNIQIICATGFYYEGEGGTAYFRFRAGFADITKEIEEMMYTEITRGIGHTGIKAGVIKLASSKDQITDYEKAFFTAGAKVAIATGVPIITHTQAGTMGPEQAQLLLNLGVPANQIMIGHMDGNMDINYHKKTLDQGVRIAFDRCGLQYILGMPTDQERVTIFAQLIQAGYTQQLHLSHDFILHHLGRPIPQSPKSKQILARYYLGNIFDNIIPELMAEGVLPEQIEEIMVGNVRGIFS